MTNLDQLLLDRACRYGSFADVAKRSHAILISIINHAPQTSHLKPHHTEAFQMIATKLARLVNGQINDLDSWRDIAGYAMLVHNQIEQEQEAKAAKTALDAMEAEIAKELKEEA